jgi:hypothetical protein
VRSLCRGRTTQRVSDEGITGEDSDVVQVESINITPDPPQPGKDMTVTVKGTSSSVIEVCDSSVFEEAMR